MESIIAIIESEIRRPVILEGLSKDLSYSAIADKLGVERNTIQRDIRKMQYNKDLALKKAYNEREKYKKSKHKKYIKKIETRFQRMTGISLEEKMFKNMVHYYKKDIKRIMKSKNESAEISKLSSKIRKILVRNKIIKRGAGKYELTQIALKQFTEREDN
jgi:transcriptional antiterminator